ncbi:MAG: thymidine phosphorylase [Longimicrobiales bacterium]
MIPAQVIRRKRDGDTLAADELRVFFERYATGDVADYQMSAFLMAVFLRGMSAHELGALVDVIIGSGRRVHFSAARAVDKHSTGGVGDKVSLVLAPLVSSLGVPVPMMSGRGLGHTGGTLDKLETIPGLRTDLPLDRFRRQVEEIGCAMIGQTDEIAPLDRKLYALRDVTGTVEAIPLIASSIMSKKIAEGAAGLVLDVKRGDGAFLPELEQALELARTMIEIGAARGVDVVALLTAMDRPLGRAVGNALETAEAIDTLNGDGPADLRDLTLALAAEMLHLGGAVDDLAGGRQLAEQALADGRARAQMARIIEAQGGEARVLDEPQRLPRAEIVRSVVAQAAGRIGRIETRAIGEAAVTLGAGRASLESRIHGGVGFIIDVRSGDLVEPGQRLAAIHAASDGAAEAAEAALRAALPLLPADAPPAPLLPLISHRVSATGVEILPAATT